MKEQLLNKDENIVTIGEIAHNKQFLLFSQCFQKLTLWVNLQLLFFISGLLFFTVVFYIVSITAIVLFYVFYANVSIKWQ